MMVHNFLVIKFNQINELFNSEIEAVLEKIHKGKSVKFTLLEEQMQMFMQRDKLFILISTYDIPVEKWKKALNSMLPDDIVMN